MNNKQLAHEFANGSTSGKGSNLFIEGNTIFSYGRHFPIATRYTTKKGGLFTLFTSKSYSSTTAKHKSYVLSALHGLILTVPEVSRANENHDLNIQYIINDINNLREKAIKARVNGQFLIEQTTKRGLDLVSYIEMFNIKPKGSILKLTKDIKEDRLFSPSIIEEIKAKQKKETLAKKSREAQARQEILKKLEEWKNGEGSSISAFRVLPVAIRLKNSIFETSHGAQVEKADGLRFWQAIKNNEALENYKINEFFRVSRINEKEIIVGCHTIPKLEIYRIGNTLNA